LLWHLDVAARKATVVERGAVKKRPTACFFGDERSIVFGDKFGDGGVMHIGALHNDVAREFEFGTLSSLIALIPLGDGSGLFAVGEKDEKIIIYRFPQVHEIHSFCLGHRDFVSALACTKLSVTGTDVLVSVSGDGTLRAWHLDGRVLCEPFLVAVFDISEVGEQSTALVLRAVAIDSAGNIVVVTQRDGAALALRLVHTSGEKFEFRRSTVSADASDTFDTTVVDGVAMRTGKITPFATNVWCVMLHQGSAICGGVNGITSHAVGGDAKTLDLSFMRDHVSRAPVNANEIGALSKMLDVTCYRKRFANKRRKTADGEAAGDDDDDEDDEDDD